MLRACMFCVLSSSLALHMGSFAAGAQPPQPLSPRRAPRPSLVAASMSAADASLPGAPQSQEAPAPAPRESTLSQIVMQIRGGDKIRGRTFVLPAIIAALLVGFQVTSALGAVAGLYALKLVYADNGAVVRLVDLRDPEALSCVTDPPLAKINETLHMQQGRVTIAIKQLLALSGKTTPIHRQFCFVLECIDADLKDVPHMHARSPPFYSVAKSKIFAHKRKREHKHTRKHEHNHKHTSKRAKAQACAQTYAQACK